MILKEGSEPLMLGKSGGLVSPEKRLGPGGCFRIYGSGWEGCRFPVASQSLSMAQLLLGHVTGFKSYLKRIGRATNAECLQCKYGDININIKCE